MPTARRKVETEIDEEDWAADLLNIFGPVASAPTPTYGASPIKRKRRTKADIQAIRDEIYKIVRRYRPMTVRQVYYQLVTRSVIDKTELEYKAIGRLLVEMRRAGAIPYSWIADDTRWMRKPDTYSSLEGMLADAQRHYRRSVWDNQDAYVEIWLEKEALAGVLVDVTSRWDTPLMVTRGYPSVTFVVSAAKAIEAQQKPAYLYYFGDHDPSGVDIDRWVEKQIREVADVDLVFRRVAVTEQQIEELQLPTRPTKKSDSRSRNFKGESVEVDAIDPDSLREICESCITAHIDEWAHQRLLEVEQAERDTLATMIGRMGG